MCRLRYRRVAGRAPPAGPSKVARQATLRAFVDLAELYARHSLTPRPREPGEALPLGEGPLAVLQHVLTCFGVDVGALGEDGVDLHTIAVLSLRENHQDDVF